MATARRGTRARLTNENALTSRSANVTTLAGKRTRASEENDTTEIKPRLATKLETTVRRRAALGDLTNNVRTNPTTNPDGKVMAKKPVVAPRPSLGPRTRSSNSLNGEAMAVDEAAQVSAARPALGNKTNIPRRSLGNTRKLAQRKPTSRGRVDPEEDETVQEESNRVKRFKTSEPEPAVVEEEFIEPAKDEGWEDLDVGDHGDPSMATEYVNEVYEYLRVLEIQTLPDHRYMERQNEVTWRMRSILVDWLIEVHGKFRLLPETIFLATHIVDRFLSMRVVSLVKFQLVGVTALFIAAKYEEVVCPSVANFLYMTDGGYSDEEILKAERYVLQMIGFNLSYPNPIHFLRRISKADGYDIQSRTVAKYLMEISIVDHGFLACPPSVIAAAAAWLARKILTRGDWDPNLIHYSGYSEEELLPTAQLMLNYVIRTLRLPDLENPTFFKKYSQTKFYRASGYVRDWAERRYRCSIRYGAARARAVVRLEEFDLYPNLVALLPSSSP